MPIPAFLPLLMLKGMLTGKHAGGLVGDFY
jgi:hypothetical protein